MRLMRVTIRQRRLAACVIVCTVSVTACQHSQKAAATPWPHCGTGKDMVAVGRARTFHEQGVVTTRTCNSAPWSHLVFQPDTRGLQLSVATRPRCYGESAIARETKTTVEIAVVVPDFASAGNCRALRAGDERIRLTLRHPVGTRTVTHAATTLN